MAASPVDVVFRIYFRRALSNLRCRWRAPFAAPQTGPAQQGVWMKKNVTGALLSALVFPGVGQYWQRRRKRALLFIVPALLAGYAYFSYAIDEANAVVGQVLGGNVDPAAIAARLENQPTPLIVSVAGCVFIVCWLGSVVDAFVARER